MARNRWERERKREAAANAKILDIYMSAKHICQCTHVQGFHWDAGVGRCGVADCACTAFDEDVFAKVQPPAAQIPATGGAGHDADGEDALARAMRAEMQHEVTDDETWERALHADRPRPTDKPRPSTKQNPAVLDALRELGGSPEDLTG
jgi:hypothetical protein